MITNIIIRITGVNAYMFHELWAEMVKAGVAAGFGETMRDAIHRELCNLQIRWQDALNDAEKMRKAASE